MVNDSFSVVLLLFSCKVLDIATGCMYNIVRQLACSDVYKTRCTMKYRLTDDENLKKGVGVMNNNKATKTLSVIQFSLVDLLTAPCMNLNLFRQPSKS